MSAIYEMCSRALLSRTRFAKQKKKTLLKTATLFSFYAHSLSSTPPSFPLQEKMFKNGVLVTSGERGARECVTSHQGISRLIYCVYLCVCV